MSDQRQVRHDGDRASLILDAELDAQVLVRPVSDHRGVVDIVFLEVNEAACDLFGLPHDHLVGRSANEIAPWSSDQGQLAACQQVQRSRVPQVLPSLPITSPGQPSRLYDLRISPVEDELLISWTDVTDREQLIGDLAGHQSLLQATLDAEIDPHVRLEPIRDTSGTIVDFEYVMANDAACRYNQLTRDELLGARLLDLLPGHAEGLLQQYVAVMSSGVQLALDDVAYEIELLGGQLRYYDIRISKVGDGLSYIWRDVTDRHQSAQALIAEKERFRSVMDDAPIGMALADADGKIMRVNPAMRNLLGYGEGELTGSSYQVITHPDDQDVSSAAVANLVSGGTERVRFRKRYVRPDGSVVHADVSISCVREPDGSVRHLVAQIVDMTSEVQALERLNLMARTDAVTGLANRHEVLQRLEVLLHSARRQDGLLAVVFCDIDDFKAINDTYGHTAGDQVLPTVGERLRSAVRDSDTVARLGGDEIIALLPGLHDPQEAARVSENIREAVARPITDASGLTLDVTLSIGVTLATEHDTVDGLLARADRAMYRAKRTGRNRTVYIESGDGSH